MSHSHPTVSIFLNTTYHNYSQSTDGKPLLRNVQTPSKKVLSLLIYFSSNFIYKIIDNQFFFQCRASSIGFSMMKETTPNIVHQQVLQNSATPSKVIVHFNEQQSESTRLHQGSALTAVFNTFTSYSNIIIHNYQIQLINYFHISINKDEHGHHRNLHSNLKLREE